MSNYVLDKAYRAAEAGGIPAARVVVRGAGNDDCALPAAANAAGVLGITTHGQTRENRFIGVRRLGIALATAAGPINRGALVCAGDSEGRVAQANPPRFEAGSAAANNGLVIEWIDRGSFSAASCIDIVDAGEATAFAWQFTAGKLVLKPQWSAEITMSSAEFKAAIEADPLLRKILRATHMAGSNGTGTVAPETLSVLNLNETLNPIGIAEQAAVQAGDLIDVFLTP